MPSEAEGALAASLALCGCPLLYRKAFAPDLLPWLWKDLLDVNERAELFR